MYQGDTMIIFQIIDFYLFHSHLYYLLFTFINNFQHDLIIYKIDFINLYNISKRDLIAGKFIYAQNILKNYMKKHIVHLKDWNYKSR